MEISFKEAPSVGKESREVFFAGLKENIVHCHHEEYVKATRGEPGVSFVPLAGVSSSIETLREKESRRPVGYANPVIYVDDDYYRERFGQDYTKMLPYDLEHEMWHIYLIIKKGYNPDVIDLKKGEKVRHLGRAHQLAIKKALKKAHEDGRLDDYLQWQRIQHQVFQALSDPYAWISFAFYHREAKKLKKRSQKEKK